ncbi:MAG: hypothetical protein M1814_003229 [Vezdaea aestivalis]|nr:MAG: hypothetical protein M1814_003229 [Vezdaea aestivalis]
MNLLRKAVPYIGGSRDHIVVNGISDLAQMKRIESLVYSDMKKLTVLREYDEHVRNPNSVALLLKLFRMWDLVYVPAIANSQLNLSPTFKRAHAQYQSGLEFFKSRAQKSFPEVLFDSASLMIPVISSSQLTSQILLDANEGRTFEEIRLEFQKWRQILDLPNTSRSRFSDASKIVVANPDKKGSYFAGTSDSNFGLEFPMLHAQERNLRKSALDPFTEERIRTDSANMFEANNRSLLGLRWKEYADPNGEIERAAEKDPKWYDEAMAAFAEDWKKSHGKWVAREQHSLQAMIISSTFGVDNGTDYPRCRRCSIYFDIEIHTAPQVTESATKVDRKIYKTWCSCGECMLPLIAGKSIVYQGPDGKVQDPAGKYL